MSPWSVFSGKLRGGACVAEKFVAEISEMGGGKRRKQTIAVLKAPQAAYKFLKSFYNILKLLSK